MSRDRRIILHIDMNSYFASVEQQANPFLRGKAIAITGKSKERSVVCTASIEAKKLGVKTAMSTWEAEKICPQLIFICGDPEKYSEITARFNRIFYEFTDRVEQFSVDESFLDITDAARDYLGATIMAQMIRARLREDCGARITASIGIAPNKLMAKLASETVKPNGLTVVQPHQVIDLLDRSKPQDLCGIGPCLGRRLENLGLTNFSLLRQYPIELLIKEFKSYGYWLHQAAHGRDDSPVCTDEADPKSVGHSYTLPHDTYDPREMKRYLLKMADKIAWRLRRDDFRARTIHAYARYGDFTGAGAQSTLNQPTADGYKIYKTAWEIIEKLINPLPTSPLVRGRSQNQSKNISPPPYQGGGWGEVNEIKKPIRLLGLSCSNLSKGPEQQSIFKKERKLLSVLPALDAIQARYGARAWTRASLLKTEIKARSSGFHFDHLL
ncbi:DNA polymerase IV [Patescibacteria group bacterium]|nr:DNA polymerase IV [Patescibacteria group bacterium]MBU1705374.1 DNA polymerase IV [Patescibacteria group bacterium]